MNCIRALGFIAMLVGSTQAMLAQEQVHHLGPDISPSAHPDISKQRAAVLARLGCTLTQYTDTPELDGVFHGAFHTAGSRDLAVVCHQGGHQVVLLFWGKSAAISDSIYSWAFDPSQEFYIASRSYIIQHIAFYGSEVAGIPEWSASRDYPKRLAHVITHDGLALTAGECCSTVLYWWKKAWIDLPGAD